MRRKLTWLHISDIHFYPNTDWRDSVARQELLSYLKTTFERDDSLRPDLIFCTGDIGFGETGMSPLKDQYVQAKAFFDSLLAVSGRHGVPLAKQRLFVVPGNHDVNRDSIDKDAQANLTAWARRGSSDHTAAINQHFNDLSGVFKEAIKRLDEYGRFVKEYLPHQCDPDGRHCYAMIVDIDGLKVGVAGFNSSWSVAGPEDDRTLWLAAEWQFNATQMRVEGADIRIGLIHHPLGWLNQTERDIATRRISGHFHFWLHGHEHNAWIEPMQSHVLIAAGALGAGTSDEFGFNLVSLDLSGSKGVAYLNAYSVRDGGWTGATVARHAPTGQWSFVLPAILRPDAPPSPSGAAAQTLLKRAPRLFGREALLKDATAKLNDQPFLLVYGMRGNGKSALIEELGRTSPLSSKKPVRFTVSRTTTANELFRQFATLLGDTSEFPQPPSGSVNTIAVEVRRRYPEPHPTWVWIDLAHHLLDSEGFRQAEVRRLFLGLQEALGMQWHWIFELRERPPHAVLGSAAAELFVPGLDKSSLADCLADSAPIGRQGDWSYNGFELKRIYQWLGGGHGAQAHPLAIHLLIEVARGRNEAPLETLERHRGDFAQRLEDVLLSDLYSNVLSESEQLLMQALALYRSAIPHDHADPLERRLDIRGAWDNVDRRCLLSPSPDHSLYYVHSFVSEWLRGRLGYDSYGEDEEADLTDITDEGARQLVCRLHSAIAASWLDQLAGSRRVTNLNIGRALEAFHHLVAAGEADRLQDIAVNLLSGDLEWARRQIRRMYTRLFDSKAPIEQLRGALQFAVVLDPDDAKAYRFLGECWAKEEGRGSPKALACFEKACDLRRDFPPNWANLGRTMIAQGDQSAKAFIERLKLLEQDCPQAIDDHVRAVQSVCLRVSGKGVEAAAIRIERIHAGSRDAVFYNDEAKVRLAAGDLSGALEILDLAEKNGGSNDYTAAIRASVLQQSDQGV